MKWFEDPGQKIKSLALILFWIETVSITLTYLILIIAAEMPAMILLTPLVIAVAAGIAWLSSILLYGFGELIENSARFNKTPASYTNTSYAPATNIPPVKNTHSAPANNNRATNPYSNRETPTNNKYVSNTKKSIADLGISTEDALPIAPKLKEALAFISLSGMKANLNLINHPVAEKLLMLPDDQLRDAILELTKKCDDYSTTESDNTNSKGINLKK